MQISKEQQYLDLIRAAYHEAGHKIMYRHFGGDGDIVLWKNPSNDPFEHSWLGQFRPRTCPQELHDCAKRCGMPTVELPDNWRRLHGMAGLVAEEILSGETTDPELIAEAVDYHIYFGEASPTDLEAMGITGPEDYQFCYDEATELISYMIKNWALVQHEADIHIAAAIGED